MAFTPIRVVVRQGIRLNRAPTVPKPIYAFSKKYPSGSESKNRQPLTPILHRLFHYQSTNRLHVQTSYGILFEALQKSGYTKYDIQDIQIPEELRRLKAGSLKWLFQFWPLPKTLKASYHNEKGTRKKDSNSEPNKEESQKQLHEMVEYLKCNEIAIRRLLKLPWLLTSDPDVVEAAANRVQDILGINDFKIAISFVDTSLEKLHEIAKLWKEEVPLLRRLAEKARKESGDLVTFENRIDYFAYHLQCPKEDVTDMMAKVKYLMYLPLEHIDTVRKTIIEGGVNTEGILSDPWIFIHNLKRMEGRIRILQERGIKNFKPWLLRTPRPAFDKFIIKKRHELELLGSSKDIQGFLQDKLNCDEKAVSTILYKVPAIKNSSIHKINEMITFLYSSGFSAKHILDTPRILAHKVDTISQRLVEVRAVMTRIEDLHILCRTSKDFHAVLMKMKNKAEGKSNASPYR